MSKAKKKVKKPKKIIADTLYCLEADYEEHRYPLCGMEMFAHIDKGVVKAFRQIQKLKDDPNIHISKWVRVGRVR